MPKRRYRSYGRRGYNLRMTPAEAYVARAKVIARKEKNYETALVNAGVAASEAAAAAQTKYANMGTRRLVGRGRYSLGNGIRDAFKYASRAKSLLGMGMYTGRGSYSSNALMSGSVNTEPTYSTLDEEGALCVTNREYVCEVYANQTGTLFANNSFSLNPGLEAVFPWLSQVAQNYEEYEFKQCVFEYRSLVQDINSNNGQVGSIIMATNYNPQAPAFTDKAMMQAYAHANSFKTTDGGVHGVECDPSKLSGPVGRYIRTNPVLSGEDVKNYDHAKFQLAIHNTPTLMSNNSIGELWVTYSVVLRKPKLFSARGFNLSRTIVAIPGRTSAQATYQYPLGNFMTDWLYGQQNNIPILYTLSSGGMKMTFPSYFNGDLEIVLKLEGTNLAGNMLSTTTPTTTGGNVSQINDVYGSAATAGTAPSYYWDSLTQSNAQCLIHVRIRSATGGVDNTLFINWGLTASATMTLVQGFFDIHEYNSNFGAGSDTPVWVNASGGLSVV